MTLFAIFAMHDNCFDGGILCPACKLMHGRSADAAYPFTVMASLTGMKISKVCREFFFAGLFF